jgi:dCMP deaminase
MIIGLTGRNAAGKGEVAEFLKSKGFYYYSLSDVLREELEKRGDEVSRENLIEIGRELRKSNGFGYLAQRILAKIEPDRNYVVDSFRHTSEVAVFRDVPRFYLIAVKADAEIRFERIRARARESDPTTLEQFTLLEEKEAASEDSQGQQLNATVAEADFTLANNASMVELQELAGELLQDLAREQPRPDWDEDFMEIAKVVSLRSNCIKRKVAAVVVKDRRIISTGYNGTPRGTKNCYEGGCPRCNSLADSGTRLDECLCSHAEENAITQAAYHGVNVKGSILYSTFAPCLMCTKMIINSGISEVVYNLEYPLNDTSFKLFGQAGIKFRQHKVG